MRRRKGERPVADHLENLAKLHAAMVNDVRRLTYEIEDVSIVFFVLSVEPPRGLRALVMRDRMAGESRAA